MEDAFSRFIVSEEDIARQQTEEDLRLYGSRPKPADAVDIGESTQLGNPIPKRDASAFEAMVERPAKLAKREECKTFDDGAVTAMDWNCGASPLDAWLNQSAIPSTATVLELPDQRDSVEDLVAQEVEEIKVFRNVHVATTSSPKEKETAIDGFEGLELAAQIYYRNIRDRYPLLPTYLARRLAQANYERSERFRSERLKPAQPVRQVAVQPHSVLDSCFRSGGPPSTITQMASDLPARSNAVGGDACQMMTLDTEDGPIQVPIDLEAAAKVAGEKRKRNTGASHRFRQRRKERNLQVVQSFQRLKCRINILREMKSTSKVENYFCINPGNIGTQAPYVFEEILDSSPPLSPPGTQGSTKDVPVIEAISTEPSGESRKLPATTSLPSDERPLSSPAKKQSKWSPAEDAEIIRLRGSGMKWEDISKKLCGRSAISCRLHYQNYLEREHRREKEIQKWEEDMKDYEWRQGPHTTAGIAPSIFKGTTQLVDELVALKFAETGEAPTSPTPLSQMGPISTLSLATLSPQTFGNNLIPAVDNVPNATTQNPSLTASPPRPNPPRQSSIQPVLDSPATHQPVFPSPLPPLGPYIPKDRIDDGWFLKCSNCATKIWALDCNGKARCRQCMNLKIYVSRHYNYAAK